MLPSPSSGKRFQLEMLKKEMERLLDLSSVVVQVCPSSTSIGLYGGEALPKPVSLPMQPRIRLKRAKFDHPQEPAGMGSSEQRGAVNSTTPVI